MKLVSKYKVIVTSYCKEKCFIKKSVTDGGKKPPILEQDINYKLYRVRGASASVEILKCVCMMGFPCLFCFLQFDVC